MCICAASVICAGHVMTGMAVKVATAEEGRRLMQLLQVDSAVTSVHPVVSTAAAAAKATATAAAKL
jgi:UPF0288 family protein (methanogenesis marker protein 3)